MKLLVMLATIALLVWLVRRSARGNSSSSDEAPQAAPKARPAAGPRIAAPEEMVRCATCGLHLPASDALPAPGGRHFCCTEHRRP
jgi:uncharacterized protein